MSKRSIARGVSLHGNRHLEFRKGSAMRLYRVLLMLMVVLISLDGVAHGGQRNAEITFQIKFSPFPKAKQVRLWVPYPMSDQNQEITDVTVRGNYSYAGVFREGKALNNILYSEWQDVPGEKVMTYSFVVKRRDVTMNGRLSGELPLSSEEFREFLDTSFLGSTVELKIKSLAGEITKGKTTGHAKARAIYDWIVENMQRDPHVKGCGFGQVEKLLDSMGGKCVDIHSVFVALMRGAGIPAREIYGIRIPKASEGDMTKTQHCWSEFYLPGQGWIVADPADVRKIILEEKLSLEQAKRYREYYFGALDENRIAFGIGKNIRLNPAQSGEPLLYFMYPYAEEDGKPLNEDLYGFNLGYRIGYRAY
jgi:transglutaminase-like putative cysteine protease